MAVDSGELRVSDKLQEAQKQRGKPTYAVRDTTADPVSYEQALTAGRDSDWIKEDENGNLYGVETEYTKKYLYEMELSMTNHNHKSSGCL